MVRQFADEADGVAEQERQVLYRHLSDGGVEGREQFVLREYIGFGEQVHQRRFTHVGVAD